MNPTKPDAAADRRRFLQSVAASLSLIGVAGCTDEPIRDVSGREPPPPEAAAYAELLEKYFGADGLADVDYIGGYYAQVQRVSSSEAFDYTGGARQIIDPAKSLEAAVSDLEDEVTADFVAARVVDVAGWTLARTEVELCVLWWLN